MVEKNEALIRFQEEKAGAIQSLTDNKDTARIANLFLNHVTDYKYSYYSTWMGRPIIQLPQDIIALQEVIMETTPDLIIETGIAHGGSIVFSASMLELVQAFYPEEAINREVIGIDIDIRAHNRSAIEEHPMFKRITLLEGSSIAPEIVKKVHDIAKNHKKILVLLDSNHTESHVLAELNAYHDLVSADSYMVVYDTIIEFDDQVYENRPWSVGNNPYTAVQKFLLQHPEFQVDKSIDKKSVITSCPNGWLKKAGYLEKKNG